MDLKPCPMCGKGVTLYQNHGNARPTIRCLGEKCGLVVEEYNGSAETLALRWNFSTFCARDVIALQDGMAAMKPEINPPKAIEYDPLLPRGGMF